MDQTLLPLAIILFTISTWFVIHHAKRHTSCFIILLSIIAFGLGSAAVALLPIDLSYASSLANNNNNSTTTTASSENGETSSSTTSYSSSTAVDNNPTYLPWQVTYWTTFLLAWIILPITRETLLSGQFTFHQVRHIEEKLAVKKQSHVGLLFHCCCFAIHLLFCFTEFYN